MSSDPFDVLGLNWRTATDADVRRAYAAKLKVTRPEDDRAGFMALRQAFERAREQVRWRSEDDADEEQDHSPPDEQGQSTAHLIDTETVEAAAPTLPAAEAEPEVVFLGTDMPAEMIQVALVQDDEPDEDEDDYSYEASPEEAAFEERVSQTMNALVDVLTGSPFAASPKQVIAVVDRDEVGGIEEYQALQWQVRQLLCDRTGFHLEPPQQRLPDWLTLKVFDALDEYYGWTRQPTTNGYVRKMNDWLVGVRRAMAEPGKTQEDHRREALAELNGGPDQSKGSAIWLWVGAGILISQVVRVLAQMGGG